MLSHQILTRQDVGDVASYYGDGADDYYAKEGEAQTWQGRGAEMLGLVGSVDSRRFRELLAGKIDPDGAPVRSSTRDDSKSRIGMGLTRDTATAAQKQLATMQTRGEKPRLVDRARMLGEWEHRAAELDIRFERTSNRPSQTYDRTEAVAEAEAGRLAVQFAISHLMEREAAITASTLLDTALKHDLGASRLDSVLRAIGDEVTEGRLVAEEPRYHDAGELGTNAKPGQAWIDEFRQGGLAEAEAQSRLQADAASGRLVMVEARYTTPEALAREHEILRIERDGRSALAPVLSLPDAVAHFADRPLNNGQRSAATMMLSSSNRVVGIEGFAGTGKSHMLRFATEKIEAQGYTVRALAPYAGQVKALRGLGVTANTVASFLRAREQPLGPKSVLVIDEAGVVPARQMAKLLQTAESAGARIVLIGDRAQTKAIEAGRPFDQLIRNGMTTTEMAEIQRQTDPRLREAVELAARGRAAPSLAKVRNIVELEDDTDRRTAIAQSYAELTKWDRERTLIVAGTNEARREINALVREAIGTAGEGKQASFLVRRDTTQEQRRYSRNYDVGDTIQPERDYPSAGLVRGALYTVEENGPGNRLTVRAQDGAAVEFSPYKCSNLSVYQTERAELSRGDLVRVTRNDAALDLANGDRLRVAFQVRSTVVLTDGVRTIHMDASRPLHLDHAYATTVHSSQGLTTDRVFIEATTTSRTTAKDVYYVAISRARSEARIFTNDREALGNAISRENPKIAAMDLTTPKRALDRAKRVEELGDRER